MARPEALEARLSGLIAQLQPAERRALARALAPALRKSTFRRVADQQNPDGTPFQPRKPRSTKRRRKQEIRSRMFARLMTARYLKIETSANAASLAFTTAASRVARVHQLGLRDRVERRRNAPELRYPERELLGFTADDRDEIAERVLEHLAR